MPLRLAHKHAQASALWNIRVSSAARGDFRLTDGSTYQMCHPMFLLTNLKNIMCIQKSNVHIKKTYKMNKKAELVTRVPESIKDLKIISYMTNGDKYTLNGSAKDSDAYL